MRKITSDIVHAFIDGNSLSVGNSSTDGKQLFLFGNLIAWKGEDRNGAPGIHLTLAGYNTPTTRDRLNGVLSVMGHKRTLKGDRVLRIFQVGDLFIGHHTVGGVLPQSHVERREIRPEDTVFVVHPCTAKGMDAVSFTEVRQEVN